jgi:hypothetical protein
MVRTIAEEVRRYEAATVAQDDLTLAIIKYA